MTAYPAEQAFDIPRVAGSGGKGVLASLGGVDFHTPNRDEVTSVLPRPSPRRLVVGFSAYAFDLEMKLPYRPTNTEARQIKPQTSTTTGPEGVLV